MSPIQRLTIWLYNLMQPADEKYIHPPKPRPLVDFTFLLVGLEKVRTITAHTRDEAERKLYVLLTPEQVEQLEWAELILMRLHRTEKEYDGQADKH